jgi:hypothetical protein
MSDGNPARIDRAALERIIQRAAELQTAEREIGEELTPEQVMALGREVGIPGRYLQQALLEERTRIVPRAPVSAWERVVGAAVISAQRLVRGDPEGVTRGLLRYMEDELFCVQRQQPGRITWEPIGGVSAALRRSAAAWGSGKRPFMLSRAESVAATIVAADSGWVHVALTATSKKARAEYVGGGAAVATAGVLSAATMTVLGAFLPVALLPIPVALGLGYGAMRRYGPVRDRIQLGLERALDHLEQGAAKPEHELPWKRPGLLEMLAEEMRKTFRGSY